MEAQPLSRVHQHDNPYDSKGEISGSRKLKARNGQTYKVERSDTSNLALQSKKVCRSIHPITYHKVEECLKICSSCIEREKKEDFRLAIRRASSKQDNPELYSDAVISIMSSLKDPSRLEVVKGSIVKGDSERGHSLTLTLPDGECVVLAELPLEDSSNVLKQIIEFIPAKNIVNQFDVSACSAPESSLSNRQPPQKKPFFPINFPKTKLTDLLPDFLKSKDKQVAVVAPFSVAQGDESYEIIEEPAPKLEPMELGEPESGQFFVEPLPNLCQNEASGPEPMEVDQATDVYSPETLESFFIYPPGVYPESCPLTDEQREEINVIRLDKAKDLCDQLDIWCSLNSHVKNSLTVLFEDTDPVRKLIIVHRLRDISDQSGVEVEFSERTKFGDNEFYVDINITIKGVLFTVRVPHSIADLSDCVKIEQEIESWSISARNRLEQKFLERKRTNILNRLDYEEGDENDVELNEHDEVVVLARVERTVNQLLTLFTQTGNIDKLVESIFLYHMASDQGITLSTHSFVDKAQCNRVFYRVSSDAGVKEILFEHDDVIGILLDWQSKNHTLKDVVARTIPPMQQRWVTAFDNECKKVLREFNEDFIFQNFANLAEAGVRERAIWGSKQSRGEIYEKTMDCIKTLFGDATTVEKHLAAMELESLGDTIAAMIEVYEIRTRAYRKVYLALEQEGVSYSGAKEKMYALTDHEKVREIVRRESRASFMEYVRNRRGEMEGIEIGGRTQRNQSGNLEKMIYIIRLRGVQFPAEIILSSSANTERDFALSEGVAKRSRQFRPERLVRLFPDGLPDIP